MDLSTFIDSRGVSIFLAVVVIVVMGFMIANIVYFSRIKNGKTVTTEEASQMMWLNGLLIGVLFIMFIYYAWKSFTHANDRQALYSKVNSVVNSGITRATNVLAVPSITVQVGGQDVKAIRNPATGLYETNVAGVLQSWDCNHSSCTAVPAAGGITPSSLVTNPTDLSSL